MLVTILGGDSFPGRALAARLARQGELGGRAITGLTLSDRRAPPAPAAGFPIATLAGELDDPEALAIAIPEGTAVIFHLAGAGTPAAEADFDLGLRVNLQGGLALLEACRALVVPPRLVLGASVSGLRGGQAGVAAEALPGNSQGAQKAMLALLLQDASRHGLVDAVTLILPHIVPRPARPGHPADFVAALWREPLAGRPTLCPVPEDFCLWLGAPERAVDWLLRAATLDTAALGPDRGLAAPGLSLSAGQMRDALPEAARPLVRFAPDPVLRAIAETWPAACRAERALALGFPPQPPPDPSALGVPA